MFLCPDIHLVLPDSRQPMHSRQQCRNGTKDKQGRLKFGCCNFSNLILVDGGCFHFINICYIGIREVPTGSIYVMKPPTSNIKQLMSAVSSTASNKSCLLLFVDFGSGILQKQFSQHRMTGCQLYWPCSCQYSLSNAFLINQQKSSIMHIRDIYKKTMQLGLPYCTFQGQDIVHYIYVIATKLA